MHKTCSKIKFPPSHCWKVQDSPPAHSLAWYLMIFVSGMSSSVHLLLLPNC